VPRLWRYLGLTSVFGIVRLAERWLEVTGFYKESFPCFTARCLRQCRWVEEWGSGSCRFEVLVQGFPQLFPV
jgi:hypothetical protein